MQVADVQSRVVSDALSDAPALLTFRRAAELTGIPARTWHRWVRAGLVLVVRPCGGHSRIPRTEIARVLRDGVERGRLNHRGEGPWWKNGRVTAAIIRGVTATIIIVVKACAG